MRVAEHTYEGYKGGRKLYAVQRDGRPWALNNDHSVRGYAWDHLSAATARLAFALLVDASSGDLAWAREHQVPFGKRCLTALPQRWKLTASDIVQLVGGLYPVHTSAQPTK